MASVTVFLEAYADSPDWDVLNRLICAWREEEDLTRAQCNLPSVTSEYPGCQSYDRRTSRRAESTEQPLSMHDILIANHNGIFRNASFVPHMIQLENHDPDVTKEDVDWDHTVAHEYNRDLRNYEHIDQWFNYFANVGSADRVLLSLLRFVDNILFLRLAS